MTSIASNYFPLTTPKSSGFEDYITIAITILNKDLSTVNQSIENDPDDICYIFDYLKTHFFFTKIIY
jgi:hypothetical protein